MTALRSTLDPASPAYAEAADAMAAKLADIDVELAKSLGGGGPKYVERHHARGKLTARERIELLVDADAPFLELCPLAAYGSDFQVGASVVTGIGVVEGVECVLVSNDATVKGGTSNPWTLKKILRANQIALENRLPLISLVESGGADLPTQKEIFIPGGQMFRDLTRLSAAGIPTIALVFGNSTAGGAYVPGMSDHVVMIKERSKVFLAGPPLVKMATGEEADDESLGGAEMHARVSGLADYFAVDELDAIRIGRRIVARLNWVKQGPKPKPVVPPTSFTTSRSHPLRASLSRPWSRTPPCASPVSAAKPTTTAGREPSARRATTSARTSAVRSSAIGAGTPPASSFLILWPSTEAGRKSATAAAMTTTSAPAP